MIINFNKKLFNRKYIDLITRAYGYALECLKVSCKDLEVDIDFVSVKEIHRQNLEFRNTDRPTDVLSYPNLLAVGVTDAQVLGNKLTKNNFITDVNPDTDCVMLGCISICKEIVFKQAKEYGNSRKREMVYMAVHGLLHLLGYDHLKDEDKVQMREKEEEILNQINLGRY